MDNLWIVAKFAVSLLIGSVIGLERESSDQQTKATKNKEALHQVGVRTISLISLLGCIGGILLKNNIELFFLISIPVMTLILLYYAIHSLITKDLGITTEIALFFSFIVGVLIGSDLLPTYLSIALSVVVTLIISRKSAISTITRGIHREELNAFISYLIIALVILPFLPNTPVTIATIPNLQRLLETYGIQPGKLANVEIINPFKLWLIIALITGIDLVGHSLERIIGPNRGRILASFVGGFISSTATIQSLAQESRSAKQVNHLVAAALFANLASFFQFIILILPLNAQLLIELTPSILAIILTSFFLGMFFTFIKGKKNKIKKNQGIKHMDEFEIFAIVPALKFAMIYLLVTISTKIALELFGQSGFLISSAIASLTGTDAVTINLSQIAGRSIDFELAVITFIVINGVNLTGKFVFSFIQGKREFAIKLFLSSLLIIFSSLAGLFI